MEHRWSLRKTLQRPVLLSSPQHGTLSARMRDIGLGGMYVETDGPIPPLNALVSVSFGLGEWPHEFCLRGLVVRRTASGAGIMFIETAPEVSAALRRALYQHQGERRPVEAPPAIPAETYRTEGVAEPA